MSFSFSSSNQVVEILDALLQDMAAPQERDEGTSQDHNNDVAIVDPSEGKSADVMVSSTLKVAPSTFLNLCSPTLSILLFS